MLLILIYRASLAVRLTLARVATLKHGEFDIRVNTITIFDTSDVLANDEETYATSIKENNTNNILKINSQGIAELVCTMTSDTFTKTTV